MPAGGNKGEPIGAAGAAFGAPEGRSAARRARPLWPALLIGVGLAGTLDEIVLHQLLHWHHLYDRAGRDAGLVSDGLFHLASTVLLVIGMVGALTANAGELWNGRRSSALVGDRRRFWGGVLVGLGGFNLYDATIQHKVLRLHQVRPAAENWLPYDLSFAGVAVAVLLAGVLLLRSARSIGS